MRFHQPEPEFQPREGERVTYHDWSGDDFQGTVTGYGEKNDRPVVDVRLDNGEEKWGYLDQISPRNP